VRFQKGQSGNPTGNSAGKARKLTVRLREIILGAAPEIIEGIVKDAQAGDLEARKLYLKLLPPPARTIDPMKVKPPRTIEELKELSATLAAKVLAGDLDLETARVAGSLLQSQSATMIGVDLAIALAELKQKSVGK
jgi:hypothetical protein